MEGKLTNMALNFVLRGILGMTLIYVINQYCLGGENVFHVGLNLLSFLTTAVLGVPGVCLLYGILYYQTL
jgi:inhibitor of the pro-sigma K processing machinery